jgi:hypothetical protein
LFTPILQEEEGQERQTQRLIVQNI